MDVSRFLSIFNRSKIWTTAVIIWLCFFVGYSFYRVSPGGMSAQTHADVYDVGKGPGMPPEDVYACTTWSRTIACTRNEALREVFFTLPIHAWAAFFGSLLIPFVQPQSFVPLWLRPIALIENPYIAIPLWYLLLRGFVYLTEIGEGREERE